MRSGGFGNPNVITVNSPHLLLKLLVKLTINAITQNIKRDLKMVVCPRGIHYMNFIILVNHMNLKNHE